MNESYSLTEFEDAKLYLAVYNRDTKDYDMNTFDLIDSVEIADYIREDFEFTSTMFKKVKLRIKIPDLVRLHSISDGIKNNIKADLKNNIICYPVSRVEYSVKCYFLLCLIQNSAIDYGVLRGFSQGLLEIKEYNALAKHIDVDILIEGTSVKTNSIYYSDKLSAKEIILNSLRENLGIKY